MSELSIHFKKAGLFTSLQDSGRLGIQDKGIPIGGALDRQAAKQANQILGNPEGQPVLEVTMLGPSMHFSHSVTIAITGAQFPIKLNEETINSYEPVAIAADSTLDFGFVTQGCRAYLAIKADWQASLWQKSVSPLSSGSGILSEHIIQDGQTIQLKLPSNTPKLPKKQDLHPPNLSPIKRLRVSIGPEFEQLEKTTIAHFFGKGHIIGQEASRMGYKLETVLPNTMKTPEMISSGVLPGTIQLTSGGQPIILLADGQTTGGYPRIARIIDEDLDTVAQLKPGDEVWFSVG